MPWRSHLSGATTSARAPWAPFTCVEAAKRVLGLHVRRVMTPWQLLPPPDQPGPHRSGGAGSPPVEASLESPCLRLKEVCCHGQDVFSTKGADRGHHHIGPGRDRDAGHDANHDAN